MQRFILNRGWGERCLGVWYSFVFRMLVNVILLLHYWGRVQDFASHIYVPFKCSCITFLSILCTVFLHTFYDTRVPLLIPFLSSLNAGLICSAFIFWTTLSQNYLNNFLLQHFRSGSSLFIITLITLLLLPFTVL